MNIRPLERGDLEAVKAVISATGLFPSEMLDNMSADYFNGANQDVWLTVTDDDPIAVAYLVPERMTQGTFNLLLIAVHPDRQGQGSGSALIKHIEHMLAARDARILLVETSGLPSYDPVRNFYRHCGFEEEARIRDFYMAGEDKIVFRKAIVAAQG